MNKKKTDKVPPREALELTMRGYRLLWASDPWMFIAIAAHATISALAPYVGIYLSARIINEIAGPRDAATLTRLVLIALISAAVLALLTAALQRWKKYFDAGSWYRHNSFYANKLLSMDFYDVDSPNTHNLLSQVKQNQNWSGWGLAKMVWSFETLVKAPFTILGAIALTISLFLAPVPEGAGWVTVLNNPLFIVFIITMMLAVTTIAPLLSNKSSSYWVKCTDDAKKSNRFFCFFGFMGYERSNAPDIRIYRQEQFCQHYLEQGDSFGTTSRIAQYARGAMGAFEAASEAVSYIFTGIIYVFVCLKAWGGAFGVGSVTQYIGAITALSGGVSSLISLLGQLRNNAGFLRTTFEFLDIPNHMYQGSLTTEKRSDKKYEIEFRNVSFKYPSTEDYALKNVSLKFNVGQRLAIVGENGSGKTTFNKLLCRLYDPTEGEILLNGIDIRKYDYAQYMDIFSVVFQDFQLLSYSLGQNVAASMAYNRALAADCLVKAGFGERMKTMAKGLDTHLYKHFDKEGIEISGGEAQKIALARALYKDAPFIILDEPTAALDPVAEFDVYSKMNEIVGDKTAVFISHRLSSCRFCNDIAVFHEGSLIQRGGHDDLAADTTGKYHELWNAQAQYYTDIG